MFPEIRCMTNRFLAGMATVITWLLISPASATTVIPPTFEEMADRAELVFVGKAVGSRAEWRTVRVSKDPACGVCG